MTTALVCVGIVALFLAARRLAALLKNHPLANPILMAAVAAWALLALADMSLAQFEAAAQPLRWLLGPATVALAHFIAARGGELRRTGSALIGAVVIGSLVGILAAAGLARLLGLDVALTQALAAKSVTSPFAIALMDRLGGPAALAAGLVIATGIVGAILLPPLLRAAGVRDTAATGVAMGQAAHIVGTDALARRDPRAAGYAGLAMALAGIVTAVLLPLLWPWLR